MMGQDIEDVNKIIDAAVSGLARANAAGIAVSVAASFQGISITFPLGCFLLAAFGYGLHRTGEILRHSEAIVDQVSIGITRSQNLGFKLPIKKIDPIKDPAAIERAGIYLDFYGVAMLISFFLIGVIAGFVVVAF